ncbi:MAG TPA: O-antigen ligase family protein [Leptospiraceae bacterium]|nr:O-antigen ligase family protein [Leptospirales bacterium]HMY45798.1 O-antigen ligase family protein [Leptospiraceae bacterium]HNE22156.1 O-antigen ligase family protein [Leptospiraceae bacterium]HNN60224.1 O-antigen ligase family protein [Leptospiraceae bacterium]
MQIARKYSLSARTAACAIFCASFSVSYTASFLGLSLFFRIVEWRKPQGKIPPPFLAAILMYAWLLLDWCIHLYMGEANLHNLVRGETGDVFLFLFGLHVYFLLDDDRHRIIILKGFTLFAIVIVISGALSVFSEQRLARAIYGKGFLATSITTPQHLFAVVRGIAIYRPIGFMNTRLTYAGILIMVIPFVFHFAREATGRKNQMGWIALLVLSLAVLVANGTRSAQIGIAFALCVSAAEFLFRTNRRLFFAAAIAATMLISLVYLYGDFSGRQTDFQRPILWTGAGAIFENHPWIGTGPGGFASAILEWKKTFNLSHPMSWYYVESTPSGHAHSDLLHLSAIGGIPGCLFFLSIVALSVRTVASQKSEAILSRSALIAFFAAGVAQCYFQDDEVVVIYWVLLAFLERMRSDQFTGNWTSLQTAVISTP